MRSIVSLPEEFANRPFRVGEGIASGLSASRLRGKDLARPLRGVRVVEPPASRKEYLAAAAARLRPWQALGGSSAAAIWNIPLPPRLTRPGSPVVVANEHSRPRPRGAGFVGVRLTGSRFHAVELDGIPLTDPLTTWCLLSRELQLHDLVAAGDLLVTPSTRTDRRFAQVGLDELAHAIDVWGSSPGAVLRRKAFGLVRVGVDSPMESLMRMTIIEAGLPEPRVHPVVDTCDGETLQPDLGYERLRLGIEYEGAMHADPVRMRRDIARIEALAEAGWETLRVTVDDLFPSADRFLRRLVAAMHRCNDRLQAGQVA